LQIASTDQERGSASTRAASECEWTVFRSLANTAVAYSTSVCVLRRVCIRVRVRSLHERTATAQSDHSHNRPPPQHQLQLLRLRYTATHNAPALSPSPSPCPSPQSIQRVACRTSAGQRDLRRWSWSHAGHKIWRALPHAGWLPLRSCLAQRCGEEETPPCDRLKYCSLYRPGPVPAAAAAFSFAFAPWAGILTWNTRLMSPRR